MRKHTTSQSTWTPPNQQAHFTQCLVRLACARWKWNDWGCRVPTANRRGFLSRRRPIVSRDALKPRRQLGRSKTPRRCLRCPRQFRSQFFSLVLVGRPLSLLPEAWFYIGSSRDVMVSLDDEVKETSHCIGYERCDDLPLPRLFPFDKYLNLCRIG